MSTRSLILALLLLFLSVSLGANDSDGSDEAAAAEVTIDEILVTATRTEEATLGVHQHVEVITAAEIEAAAAPDLAAVLDRVSGLSVSDYGPRGAQQNISMRGSTSEQVLVLLDGIRLNNAQSGGVDLSVIPLDSIERIEIVRGGTSSVYGADAIGGVINIITKKEAANRFQLTLENGSYIPQQHVTDFTFNKVENPPNFLDLVDSQEAALLFSRALGRSALNLSGSFVRAGNGFVFKDTNDEDRRRQNAGLVGGDLTAGLHVPAGTGRLGMSGSLFLNKKGVPGSSTSPSLNATQADQRVQGVVSYDTTNFLEKALSFNLKGHYTFQNQQYEDPPSLSTHALQSGGMDLAHELFATDLLALIYGGSVNFDRLDSNVIGVKSRIYAGGFLELPVNLSDRASLQPAVRYDYYSDFTGSLNYKLGVVYRLSDNDSFKASVSKSFRAPTFNDLYWPADAFAEGDPDLQPESGYELDAGFTRRSERLEVDLFGFVRYGRDVILWQPGLDGIWRPSNFGDALYPGIEISMHSEPMENFRAGVEYTYLHTFVLSGDFSIADNKRLPMIPVHELGASLAYDNGNNHLSASLRFESLRYERTDNKNYLPSHTVVDLLYRRAFGETISLYTAVDNLFNESYEIVDGYPMPGTRIRTGLEILL
jgi:outer membrane cobalamin receptor